MTQIVLETSRLLLRPFTIEDRHSFAKLNADPEVMADLGGPLTQEQSDAKLQRYLNSAAETGVGRCVVENLSGEFLGYCGLMRRSIAPLGDHYDLGWRLGRQAWGHGYATEAAQAVLKDAFGRLKLTQILAYTTAENPRSQAVMVRLGLIRRPDLDFTMTLEGLSVPWQGLVWAANWSDTGGVLPL